jgi:hypothetical protein
MGVPNVAYAAFWLGVLLEYYWAKAMMQLGRGVFCWHSAPGGRQLNAF